MERIQFMSDLHFEFLTTLEVLNLALAVKKAGEEIEADYLALCGDITTTAYRGTNMDNVLKLDGFLRVVAPTYKGVLHITGNHEYYHKNRDVGYAREVFSTFKPVENYHFLDHELFVTEAGNIIGGTTLWFSFDHPNAYIYQNWLNDFTQIPGGGKFMKEENEKALDFLTTIEPGSLDLLMTHHGVTPHTHPKFQDNPANIYYYTDIQDHIYRLKPKFCIHGHTHDVLNYEVGETVVRTNPYGYNGRTKEFDVKAFVEI